MSKLSKRAYVPHSYFVRAALDFRDNNMPTYQAFGTLEEHVNRVRFKPEWKQLALDMVEQGLVESAYLHLNQERSSIGGGHLFVIHFKKREATGLSPSLDIPIKELKELQDKAAHYRKARSMRRDVRNPRNKPVGNWEKTGGAI